MAYRILETVAQWCEERMARERDPVSPEYRRALAGLWDAIREVQRFH
jgi:hypothetical protein